jgi:hypothetical protein
MPLMVFKFLYSPVRYKFDFSQIYFNKLRCGFIQFLQERASKCSQYHPKSIEQTSNLMVYTNMQIIPVTSEIEYGRDILIFVTGQPRT